ncbi:hypothetical protein ES703_74639 [subsurface metagenome]
MPQFNPGEERVAIATFPTKPAGLECTAELWLGSDLTKVATSGEIPFTSTGASQSISLPITLPGVEGVYPVHLSVFSNGLRIAEFRGDEDVVIAPVGVAEFTYVSSIRWTRPGGQHRFEIDVQNVGNVAGVCSLAMLWRERYESLGEDWRWWHTVGLPSATLQPGETRTFGYTMVISFVVDHFQVYFTGSPGTSGIKYLRHTPRATNGWWQV